MTINERESLGDKLRILRSKLGLTQQQIASCLGIERSTYTYYELNRTIPGWDTLRKLGRIFGVPTVDLLEDEDKTIASDFSSSNSKTHGMDLSALNAYETNIVLSIRALSKKNQKVANSFINDVISTLRKREG